MPWGYGGTGSQQPPEPTGGLQVNEETKVFEIWDEASPEESETVSNCYFQLHASCENWLSSSKYVVLAVKFEKVDSFFPFFCD